MVKLSREKNYIGSKRNSNEKANKDKTREQSADARENATQSLK